jgi:hypothetical protein
VGELKEYPSNGVANGVTKNAEASPQQRAAAPAMCSEAAAACLSRQGAFAPKQEPTSAQW